MIYTTSFFAKNGWNNEMQIKAQMRTLKHGNYDVGFNYLMARKKVEIYSNVIKCLKISTLLND